MQGHSVKSETEQHEPGDACGRIHCWYCNVDHPDKPGDYRACFECGHVYRTPEELVEEYRELLRALCEMSPEHPWGDVPEPDKIWACPLCSHDF